MKPITLAKSAAALMLSAALLLSAASATAPGVADGLQNRASAPARLSSPSSGGFITLASKSKAKQKQKAKAKRKAAAKKAKAKKLIAVAKSKLGKRYETAALGPNTFDCSGFTAYAYRAIGISLHHYAKSQGFGRGGRVSRSRLQRGDLLFFNTSERRGAIRYHVGIYLGGGHFIHASSSAKKVVIHSIRYGFYRSAFLWGKRLF